MAAFPSSPQPSTEPPKLLPPPHLPRTKGPIFFFLILFTVPSFWYFRPKQEKPGKTVGVSTIKPVRGAIEAVRRIGGSITAGRFANITVPILQAPDTGRGLTLTYLASSGRMW